jgi:putative transposase
VTYFTRCATSRPCFSGSLISNCFIAPVAVRCPRVRDRVGEGSERIRFSSAILPPYARRSKSLEVLIPILYLKGISTGDFEES